MYSAGNTKKILVTGATGKAGSRLVPRLARRGYKVRALVRDISVVNTAADLGVELVKGDLLNPSTLTKAVEGIDIVIHLASFYKGATEEQCNRANIAGTEALAKAAINAGVKQFIFSSSNRVYGTNRGKLVTENDPTQPSGNRFAVAKVSIENTLAKLMSGKDIALCILRLPLLYGDNDRHLNETLAELNNWPPSKRLQMLHHSDLALAINLCIARNAGGIFNVTDDAPLTIGELRSLHGLPGTPGAEIPDPWEMLASNLKIREQLGFRPIYPTFYSARDAGQL